MVIHSLKIKEYDYQSLGKAVINTEIEGLKELAKSLDHTFHQAVELIKQIKGRLIVSGVGKSGHIGRKIASTFASTGQPAFFVHAAEAAHGDLGMVVPSDVLLLISHSGEAKELHALINYAHRFSIPIISITGKSNSTLVRVAKVALVLPPVKEACPMGLAPTTSSTLTLALGDALAVTLLESRGFSKQDFRIFHPGGALGQQLKTVKDCMHIGSRLPLVKGDMLMSECLFKMTHYGFGCVGIVDDNDILLGIITDGDLRRHMNPELLTQKAEDVMTENPITAQADWLMADILAVFEQKSITSVFIVDENKHVEGIIHLHDCLRNHVA